MDRGSPSPDRRRLVRVATVTFVLALHAGLFAAIGLGGPGRQEFVDQAPITVELFTPPVPPPPPAPEPTIEPVSPDPGGGAPAAPSVIRPALMPVERPEVVAPPVPAPEQPLVIGIAPTASPTPGQGQGGIGEGTGSGVGDGDGPGRGGTPPLIVRGASPREILSVVPPEARQARQAGRAAVNCVILADQRLDDCRIVSETPQGYSFGEAGLRAATFFRYRPPMTSSGRPLEGQRVTINVMFGRQ